MTTTPLTPPYFRGPLASLTQTLSKKTGPPVDPNVRTFQSPDSESRTTKTLELDSPASRIRLESPDGRPPTPAQNRLLDAKKRAEGPRTNSDTSAAPRSEANRILPGKNPTLSRSLHTNITYVFTYTLKLGSRNSSTEALTPTPPRIEEQIHRERANRSHSYLTLTESGGEDKKRGKSPTHRSLSTQMDFFL